MDLQTLRVRSPVVVLSYKETGCYSTLREMLRVTVGHTTDLVGFIVRNESFPVVLVLHVLIADLARLGIGRIVTFQQRSVTCQHRCVTYRHRSFAEDSRPGIAQNGVAFLHVHHRLVQGRKRLQVLAYLLNSWNQGRCSFEFLDTFLFGLERFLKGLFIISMAYRAWRGLW